MKKYIGAYAAIIDWGKIALYSPQELEKILQRSRAESLFRLEFMGVKIDKERRK